jgi:hypothetical protein
MHDTLDDRISYIKKDDDKVQNNKPEENTDLEDESDGQEDQNKKIPPKSRADKDWRHDLFDEEKQGPKSRHELVNDRLMIVLLMFIMDSQVNRYGKDIRHDGKDISTEPEPSYRNVRTIHRSGSNQTAGLTRANANPSYRKSSNRNEYDDNKDAGKL